MENTTRGGGYSAQIKDPDAILHKPFESLSNDDEDDDDPDMALD